MTQSRRFPVNHRFLSVAFLFVASSMALSQEGSSGPATISERARAIHDSAIVVDTHADTPQRFVDEGFDLGNTDPKDSGHISLDKAHAGNLVRSSFLSGWTRIPARDISPGAHSISLIRFTSRRRAIPTA